MLPAVGPPGSLGGDDDAGRRAGLPGDHGAHLAQRGDGAGPARAGAPIGPAARPTELPCPILIQIADRDAVVPVKAAQDAAWSATGRAEVRTYPIGHFDIYSGEPFERAVADQLHFLRRHLGSSRAPAATVDAGERAPLG